MASKLLSLSALVAAALLTGCGQPAKVTGGGTMNSAGGSDKAVFTFQADSCDAENIKGSINFHDSSAIDFEDVNGVKFKGEVQSTYYCSNAIADLSAAKPTCECAPGYQEVNFEYDSSNSQAAGDGTGIACLADFGEKGPIKGMAIVTINSGPYQGYTNAGTLEGNVQQHACKAE